MFKYLKLVSVLIFSMVILGLFPVSYAKAAPKIDIPKEHALGDIPQEPPTKLELTLKNSGDEDLIISALSTSCHCITAKIDGEGIESPEFSRHKNKNWQGIIKAEKSAKLIIEFDPTEHNVIGPFTRDIFISTNDPNNQDITINITGNVNVEGISDELSKEKWNFWKVIPLILSTGFLDGINPCAIGVLLLFIAFLYTLRRTRANIIWMGIVYILAIYLAYLGIGIGLFEAVVITGYPDLFGKIASILVIVLGLINVKDYFFPGSPISLRAPGFSKDLFQKWMEKATLPAAFVFGFLVGLCTFPCSGGIYVAIVGLLANKTTQVAGFGYLLIYNLMFVMPLIILLAAISANKYSLEKLNKLERSKSKLTKLISGIVMILLGIGMLIWIY